MLALSLTGQQLWSVFTAKAELVGAAVLRAANPGAAVAALHEAGATEVVHTASVAQHFPQIAAEAGSRVERGTRARDVLAVGLAAVAETGSVVIDEPDVDRAACFLAERLWLLVQADQIVPSLEGGLERIQALIDAGAHHPQLITGPSRTADIERVLTIGVHGPRALMVLVVGDAAHRP
jgi:L-lactate dehydrogenase complex protein LldG